MTGFAKPIVVASKCLELAACRYNGQKIRAPFVVTLMPHVDLRPICPEVEIGLGTPRDPIRIVTLQGRRRLVQPTTGADVTDDMEAFSDRFLGGLETVDGFILKSRSPSCGIKDTKVYGESAEGGPITKDAGLFGGAVLERFPHAAVEDEGRLTNFRLRHHFLTKIFTLAAFRHIAPSGRIRDLVQFHASNKLLLMAYHQTALRALGRIVANAERRPFAEVLAAYQDELALALARPARNPSHVNVLTHAMGYFKDGLAPREKAHFLNALEGYRAGRATLQAPLAVLQSWIHRFEEPYLVQQTYLEPYPAALMDLGDSGKN